MTAFRVKWSKRARTFLAAVWLATTNRNAVTRASAAIEKALAADPRFHGHEISEGLWKIERVPLTAFHEVDDANNVVKVTKLAFNP